MNLIRFSLQSYFFSFPNFVGISFTNAWTDEQMKTWKKKQNEFEKMNSKITHFHLCAGRLFDEILFLNRSQSSFINKKFQQIGSLKSLIVWHDVTSITYFSYNFIEMIE